MNTKNMSTAMVGLFSLMAIALQPAQAVVLVSAFFDGTNDCKGYFGDSFDACTIFIDEGGERIELSPVIAKLEVGNAEKDPEWEINTGLYPGVTADQFTVTGTGGEIEDELDDEDKSGTWSYTQDEGDPGVRYWAVKSAEDFTLYWEVDDADIGDGNPCVGGTNPSTNKANYTLDCLNEANVVASNVWETQGQGISHITFYDTEVAGGDGTTGEEEIPEPGVLALLGMGLLGMLLARRRYS